MLKQLLIAVLVGTAAATLGTLLPLGQQSYLLYLLLCAATAASVLLANLAAAQKAAPKAANKAAEARGETGTAPDGLTAAQTAPLREQGTVKWFNPDKGFGFIIRANGEEIFVHFRSIRGEGRRSLKDGQEVSFLVTETEKGPQAEDVEAL